MSVSIDDLFGTDTRTDAERAEAERAERRRPATHGSGRRRGSRRRRQRRRRILLIVALCLAAALVIPVGTAVIGYLVIADDFDKSTTTIENAFPTVRPDVPVTGAVNILLIGSDVRGELGEVFEGATGQRADTMMLVHISADRQHVAVVSLMRDLWTAIPGHGEAKLNAAFAWGGTALTIQTIESILGARIDHVAVIDFEGFADMTTALGGVDVYSEYAFTSQNMTGYSFDRGINHIEGNAALAFVRERYSFADADYQRVRNQREFVKGVLAGLISRETLLDPGSAFGFVSATARHLSADPGLDFRTLTALGFELREVDPTDVDYFTLPTLGTGTSADGQSIVLPDAPAAAEIGAAIASDDLSAYLASHEVDALP